MTQLPEGALREGSRADGSLRTQMGWGRVGWGVLLLNNQLTACVELTKVPALALPFGSQKRELRFSHSSLWDIGIMGGRPHYTVLGALGGEGSERGVLEPEKSQNHPA